MPMQSPVLARRLPSPPFSPYIKEYYVLEIPMHGINTMYSPATLRNLMIIRYEDRMSIQFNAQQEQVSDLISITGISNTPYEVMSDATICRLFIIEFTAIGISSFFKETASAFINNNLSLSDIISQEKKALLSEQLAETASINEKVACVESFFTHLLPNAKQLTKIDSLLNGLTIIHNTPDISVKELSANLKVSDRHLRRLFNTHIGISPKEYTRLHRFSQIFNQIIEKKEVNISFYYDEPHFIKEFSSFSGFSPQKIPNGLISTEHLLKAIPYIDSGIPR